MSPREEYSRRLQARQRRAAEYGRQHVRVGNLRLLIFALSVALAWLAFWRHALSPGWISVPFVAFALVASYHSRVLQRRTLAERGVRFYQNGLGRISDKWAGSGPTGERFNDPHHVYAADLDLFGSGGLFELLSTARTRMGENTLAAWLLAPSQLEQIRQRQAAARDLRDKLDLREDLAVLGEDASVGVHPKALVDWAESPNRLAWPWLVPLAVVLSSCAVATAIVWARIDLMLPFVVVVAVEGAIAYWLRHRLDEVLHLTEHAFEDLNLLSAVLSRLEQEQFQSTRLRALKEELTSHHMRGSEAIRRLRRIVDLSMSRDNLFLRLIDIPLMYSIQVAVAAEKWRRAHGGAVGRWLKAIGELEALLSISTYSYEHPLDPFPEFVEGPACLEAQDLGHPLIPAAACVRNDVQNSAPSRVLLVSGSNMSGKSTLLRAVGINTVLAMMGAPVRARCMCLTPLQVGASIRINDSLQEGNSRFYAEITRLRQIYDLASGQIPLLFLLDELLQGTNSRDRKIGGEGIVRALLARGSIGLVTTHDLALTDIGGRLAGQLRNVHFQDNLENGRISFDYKLREGIVTKSNGLALMRSIGLDV